MLIVRRSILLRISYPLALFLSIISTWILAAEPNHPKKVIHWGWDEPNTTFIRENVQRMEELPFDGFVFHVQSNRGGNLVWHIWSDRQFELTEFEHAIENLRATEFRRLTDRFLRVNVTPGDVDWFDDDTWNIVLHNFGVAAAIAKQTDCKGLMFDVEQYETELFDYAQQPQDPSKPLAEYRAHIRRRGQQWIEEVNRHFSDVTILLTFGYKITRPPIGKPHQQSKYALLADFLDGMLEGCSTKTHFVDAWEYAYSYKMSQQFKEAYETIKQRSVEWTGLPNQYRKHVTAGFGIWMDYDWRKKGWNVEELSKNHFSPKDFESAVRFALQATDRYVWIYNEQPRWLTGERLPVQYTQALERARTE